MKVSDLCLILVILFLAFLVPSPAIAGEGIISLGPVSISLYGLCVALAAVLWLLLLSRASGSRRQDTVVIGLFVLPLSLVGARLFFCLARFEFVFLEMGLPYALSTWNGGFMMWGMLSGGVLGVYLAARRLKRRFSDVLNSAAIPTAAVIAVLRLAEYFTTEGRGRWLEESGDLSSFFCRLPFALRNEYGEWQLAVFLWEAVVAVIILIVLCRRRAFGQGQFMLLILFYSAAQIVLESLRMDSCPRIGFVRVSQVLSVIALLICVFLRNYRLRSLKVAFWKSAIVILCMTAVGILEWALDKTTLSIPLGYALMCTASLIALTMGFPKTSESKK